MPVEAGLIVADPYSAEIVREAPPVRSGSDTGIAGCDMDAQKKAAYRRPFIPYYDRRLKQQSDHGDR
jgi:hypothetical protein